VPSAAIGRRDEAALGIGEDIRTKRGDGLAIYPLQFGDDGFR
jgi:hypothetical protein